MRQLIALIVGRDQRQPIKLVCHFTNFPQNAPTHGMKSKIVRMYY